MSNLDFKRRRHELRISGFAILCGVIMFSGRQTASGQDIDAFIAGCAARAFDAYPDLKSNCPLPRVQATTVITQPLAYTPQQFEEMNRYAQQGAAALQQYLQKPVSQLNLPATGDAPSFLPNTKPKSDSIDYQPMPFYPRNGNSGGALTGIAKSDEAYRQRSASFSSLDSSLKLAQAQKELEEAKAELTAHIVWGEFLRKKETTREAGSQELAEAMAAGAPMVKDGLALDEAKKLQSQLGLDPHQKHIFPNLLTIAFDSKGQMHLDPVGLPIEEFRYTLVGDVVTPHDQEMIRARSWQGFETAPNELLWDSPQRMEPDLASTMDWLNSSSLANSGENRTVHIGTTYYFTSVFSPLLATGPGEGRIVVLTTYCVSYRNVERVEASFNIRDIDPHTVALRKSSHGDFYIFTARTSGSASKIYDRTHDQGMSSIAFEIAPEYGPRFAGAFKRAVILAAREATASQQASQKE